jgi:DNA-binding transcriptional LysR family regulator
MEKSQVTRRVRRLEQGLQVALLVRTMRSVRPTPEGESLLSRVGPALEELDRALASPAHLERRGTPTRLEHLAAHQWLWSMPQKGASRRLHRRLHRRARR